MHNLEKPKIGIGCMRWIKQKKHNREMAHRALACGMNYFETAPAYTRGFNEFILADALSGIQRERYMIASKLHIHLYNTYEEYESSLDRSLQSLHTDYLDFYLLHRLDRELYEKAKTHDALIFLKNMVNKGKIRRIGFSFHDNYNVFKQIINEFEWDFAQIQMNYLDDRAEATTHGIALAKEKAIPIHIMQPLKGGLLANLPPDLSDVFKKSGIKEDPVTFAYKWLYQMENIDYIIAGVTEVSQIDHLSKLHQEIYLEPLSNHERDTVEKLKTVYYDNNMIDCINCMYCNNVCPQGIQISHIFTNYNLAHRTGHLDLFINHFNGENTNCIKCGKCMASCPRKIDIIHYLTNIKNIIKKA